MRQRHPTQPNTSQENTSLPASGDRHDNFHANVTIEDVSDNCNDSGLQDEPCEMIVDISQTTDSRVVTTAETNSELSSASVILQSLSSSSAIVSAEDGANSSSSSNSHENISSNQVTDSKTNTVVENEVTQSIPMQPASSNTTLTTNELVEPESQGKKDVNTNSLSNPTIASEETWVPLRFFLKRLAVDLYILNANQFSVFTPQ